MDYVAASGQLVNPNKSFIYFGSVVTNRRRSRILSILEMRSGSLPFMYLGVPLFQGKPRRAHLQPLADKIIAKFSHWKGKHLSMVGHLTLIKSVFLGSFIHSFTVYKWPTSLLKYMEFYIRNFFWMGDIHKKHLTLVAWGKVCLPFREGGIGVHNLSTVNNSLLLKFTWDFVNNSTDFFIFLRRRYINKFNVL